MKTRTASNQISCVESGIVQNEFDSFQIQEQLNQNPLLCAMKPVLRRVASFKKRASEFYFEVLMITHPCPVCGGRMRMTGQSECSCKCGVTLDPTVEFQRSDCCGAKVMKNVLHYACVRCGKNLPSRYLFDERVFDREYFRHMMRASREKRRRKQEEIKRLLANSRSDALQLTELPSLEEVPGLETALDEFVGTIEQTNFSDFEEGDPFHMEDYRDAILCHLEEYGLMFSSFPAVCSDLRRDRVRRFITLTYMWQDGEVSLEQQDDDILVGKYETDNEG